jgi:hypothetical protein
MKHIKNFFAMLVAMMMVLAFVACSSSDDDDDDDSVVSKSEDIISVAKKAATITVASADDLKLQSGVYKFAYDYVYDGEDEDEDDGVKYTRDVAYGTITVNSDKSTVIWEMKSSYSKMIFSDESNYEKYKSIVEKEEALIKGMSFSSSDSALTIEASCSEEFVSAVRDQYDDDDSPFYYEDTYEEFIKDLFDDDEDLTTTVKQNSDGSKIYVYTTGVCDGVTETLVTALVKQ